MKAIVNGIKTNGESFSYTIDNIKAINYFNGSLIITRENVNGDVETRTYNEACTSYDYNIAFA